MRSTAFWKEWDDLEANEEPPKKKQKKTSKPKAKAKAKGKSKAKAKGKVPDNEPAKGEDAEANDEDSKATFARRYRPAREFESARWLAMRAAFNGYIAPHVSTPCAYEEWVAKSYICYIYTVLY